MSNLSPTLASLLALGFERRPDVYGMAAVAYRFPQLDLTATDSVNQYSKGIVSLGGVLNTGRTLAQVGGEIPPDLSSPEAAAEWVRRALRGYLSELEPLPEWLAIGEGDVSDHEDEEIQTGLTEDDRDCLGSLIDALRMLSHRATSGNDLAGIGEAWNEVDQILNDELHEIGVNLSITVGYRRGTADFAEGRYACVTMNWEDGIVLDELITSYSSDIGSDHSTTPRARLTADGGYDIEAVLAWISLLRDLCAEDNTRISVSRDHL